MKNTTAIKIRKIVTSSNPTTINFSINNEGILENSQSTTISSNTTSLSTNNMFGKPESKKVVLNTFNSFKLNKDNQLQDMLTPLPYS